MLLIRSRNLEQATEFAKRHKLKRWRYLSGNRCLIGTRRGENYINVGEYWENERYGDIGRIILERELNQVFESQMNTYDD